MRAAFVTRIAAKGLPVSGAALWLDAAQITGAVDGNPVGTWTDASGNSRNATQATTSAKPTYRSTGALLTPTGKPVLQFDGVDDILSVAAPVVTTANDVTIFAVQANLATMTGFAAPPYGIFNGNSNNNGYGLFPTNAGNSGSVQFLTTLAGGVVWTQTTLATPTVSTWHTVALVIKSDKSSTVSLDGTTASLGVVNFVAPTGTAQIGRDTNRGSASIALAEVIVYPRALTTAERQQVEAYLRAKHGTP